MKASLVLLNSITPYAFLQKMKIFSNVISIYYVSVEGSETSLFYICFGYINNLINNSFITIQFIQSNYKKDSIIILNVENINIKQKLSFSWCQTSSLKVWNKKINSTSPTLIVMSILGYSQTGDECHIKRICKFFKYHSSFWA